MEARRAARRRRRTVRRRRRRALGAVALVAFAGGIAMGASAGPRSAGTQARAQTQTARAAAARRNHHHHHHVARPQRTGLTPGAGADATVPILMYHVIAAPPRGRAVPRPVRARRTSSPNRCTRSSAPAGTAVTHGPGAPRTGAAASRCRAGKPIVLSFDNGYHSQYTQALPVLRRLGWVGVENIQLTGLPPSQGGLGDARGPRADRRRLGARHAGHQPRRPDHARRRGAARTGRRRAQRSCSAATTSRSTGSATRPATTTRPWSPPSARRATRARRPSCPAGRTRATTPTACLACACSAGPAPRRCSRRSPPPRHAPPAPAE